MLSIRPLRSSTLAGIVTACSLLAACGVPGATTTAPTTAETTTVVYTQQAVETDAPQQVLTVATASTAAVDAVLGVAITAKNTVTSASSSAVSSVKAPAGGMGPSTAAISVAKPATTTTAVTTVSTTQPAVQAQPQQPVAATTTTRKTTTTTTRKTTSTTTAKATSTAVALTLTLTSPDGAVARGGKYSYNVRVSIGSTVLVTATGTHGAKIDAQEFSPIKTGMINGWFYVPQNAAVGSYTVVAAATLNGKSLSRSVTFTVE
jgi:hypothetical protein